MMKTFKCESIDALAEALEECGLKRFIRANRRTLKRRFNAKHRYKH